MSRMTKSLMAAVAVLLIAAPFSYAGGSSDNSGGNNQGTAPAPSVPSTPTAPAAARSPYFTGDGGSGMSLAVLVPSAQGIAADQNYLPTMVQGVLVSDLAKYSAVSVLDRLRLETVLRETESGIYRNEEDFGRLGQIANVDYALTGSITRTGSGYAMQIQVVGTGTNTIGVTKAAYSGTCTIAEFDNFTGIRKASLELLTQMGVALTDQARQELSAASSAQTVSAQTALAQGITSQRQGTEVAALSYYFQAVDFDSSLAEAANRSSILSRQISSGNIGDDVRNEIQWRRDWVARLAETEQYFNNFADNFFDNFLRTNSMPYTLFYSTNITRQGEINFQTETITLGGIEIILRPSWVWIGSVEPAFRAVQRTVQAVNDGLNATGRRTAWGLDNWPGQGGFNLRRFGRQNKSFSVIIELVNSRNQVIGRQTLQTGGTYEIPVPLPERSISFSVSADDRKTVSFTNVKANDITDSLTIRIASVNGQNAETAARNGVLQIRAVATIEELTNIVIPDGVVSIGASAFRNNQLTSVIIPNSVTSIGEAAFFNNQLTSVTIPNSVTSIGASAFRNNQLTSVTIPNSVISIEEGAFSFNRLTSVTIPNSVTRIEVGTFNGNPLTSVTIPNSVTRIGAVAFNNSELTRITIGANVTFSSSTFSNNFDQFYNSNGKKAGTYTYSNNRWSYSAR